MAATQQANDLAAFIVQRLGRIETLKLQKLLYYCNAWNLALRGRPMFPDQIEAWKHGPVISSIYTMHRKETSVDSWEAGDATRVSMPDQDLATAVINLYGARSGWALRNLTHKEDPWMAAWDRCGHGERYGEVITEDEMGAYYRARISAKEESGNG
ncbi:Panacea domain-containing protein [Paeniglutamicibacter sp. MACA_103]|uniref:Panacea domain-containing protein n=1 Tax=Paeniglutamicibacter sp. MACA_103 TaxID=3377337 RepID=UPI0038965EF5